MAVQRPKRRLSWFVIALAVASQAVLPRLSSAHPLFAGLTVGTRAFEKGLDLKPEAAFGFRIGTGLNDRMSVRLEYLYTAPSRKVSGSSASITAYRFIGRAAFTSWSVRPYAELGFGGILFDFRDTYDTAAGTLMGGAGLEVNVSRRVCLSLEGSADFYRYRAVTYDETGQELSSTARSTDNTSTLLVGMQVSF